jgi:hypothetical protein
MICAYSAPIRPHRLALSSLLLERVTLAALQSDTVGTVHLPCLDNLDATKKQHDFSTAPRQVRWPNKILLGPTSPRPYGFKVHTHLPQT